MNTLPPSCQEALDAYIDALTSEEKEKLMLSDYFSYFFESFSKGAKSVGATSKAGSEEVEDSEKFMQALSTGKTISELYGFSEREISHFYERAYELFQHGHYDDAKNSYFFLVTICPIVYDFWLGLAVSFVQLQEYQAAADAASQVIALAPQECDGYLCKARALCELGDYHMAQHFLDETSDFAQIHKNERWAEELFEACHAAKEEVAKWKNEREKR